MTELTVTSSPGAGVVEQTRGPLSPSELAALLRATAAVCHGIEGRDHTVKTAVYFAVDRADRGLLPELEGVEALTLGDDSAYGAVLYQVAAALGHAVFGTAPADPVTAALKWQKTISTGSAVMLGEMLETAACELEREQVPGQGGDGQAADTRRQG